MTANVNFLRVRGSGIGGMSITESWCGGCGDSIVNASTACDSLCRECRKLDDQALVVRMAGALMKIGKELALYRERESLVRELCAACEVTGGREEHERMSVPEQWRIDRAWSDLAVWEFNNQELQQAYEKGDKS